MLTKFRGHLRSNVVAYFALFVALSASAYAAVEIPKNSVRSKQIKDNSVRSKDIRDDKVTGTDVQDDSLGGADVDEATLAGVDADQLDGLDSSDIGLAFFTGRINDLEPAGSVFGAPSGVTAQPSVDVTHANSRFRTLSPRLAIVMRDFSVRLTQPLQGTSTAVAVLRFYDPNNHAQIGGDFDCNIPAAGSSCNASGPSASVPSNSPLSLFIFDTGPSGNPAIQVGTDAMFSWRATAP